MFTTGAFALTTLLAWFAYRKNEQERSTYYKAGDQGLPLLVDIRFDDERGKPEREIAAHRLYGVERDAFSGAGGAADIALVDICEKRLCSRPTAGESRQHVIPATSIRTIAIGMLTVATNAIATTVAAQGGRTFQMNMFSTANTALDVADMRIATVLENRVTATFLPGDHHDQLVRCPNGLGHASNIAKAWECRPALLGCAPARHDRGGPNLLGGLSVEEIGAGALAG